MGTHLSLLLLRQECMPAHKAPPRAPQNTLWRLLDGRSPEMPRGWGPCSPLLQQILSSDPPFSVSATLPVSLALKLSRAQSHSQGAQGLVLHGRTRMSQEPGIACQAHDLPGSREACWGSSSPGDVWQCPETFLVVRLPGEGCYWHLVGRGQGCC